MVQSEASILATVRAFAQLLQPVRWRLAHRAAVELHRQRPACAMSSRNSARTSTKPKPVIRRSRQRQTIPVLQAIALIFGYMKLLDPSSTVREGEFATAEQAGGVPQQIVSMYNRAINGERLAPEVRADFANQAGIAFNVYQQQYERTKQYYSDLATRSGANPQNVIVPFAAPSQGVAQQPTVSTDKATVGGYIDPRDPSNRPTKILRFDSQGNQIQ
jgi:hypothetical protein